MRRAILAVALGGFLLTGAACDRDAKSTPTAAAPAPSVPAPSVPATPSAAPAPDYSTNTALVCGKLRKIFNEDLQQFGAQVGKMIAYKEAKQAPEAKQAMKAAGAQLKTVGAEVEKETAAAQDPELQSAGATSAAKFVKSASDTTFFARIKTTKDLDRTLQGQMTEWLTPVAGYCG